MESIYESSTHDIADQFLAFDSNKPEIINISSQIVLRSEINQIIENWRKQVPPGSRPSDEDFMSYLNNHLDKKDNNPSKDIKATNTKYSNFECLSKEFFVIQSRKNRPKSSTGKNKIRKHPKKWNYWMQIIRDFKRFLNDIIENKPKKFNGVNEEYSNIINQNIEQKKEIQDFINSEVKASVEYKEEYFSKSFTFRMFLIFVEDFFKLSDDTDKSFKDQNSTRLSKHYNFSCCKIENFDLSFKHDSNGLDCFSKWQKLKTWTLEDASNSRKKESHD